MAKISNPIRFSSYFDIDEKLLLKYGVFNPTLNADTKLFIDPLLLSSSKHKEISEGGLKTYRKHFENVIKLLTKSQKENDYAWGAARKLMEFPEVKGTCLGYGAQSISGSGSGSFTTTGVMQTAKSIVDLGIDDPDLFVAMGLFEEGIGPDRISDMTTNVILSDLLKFNCRILPLLGIETREVKILLKNGKEYTENLATNPLQINKDTPIILVPVDILRDLPIATDWSEVKDAASQNSALRNKVNTTISEIWRQQTIKDKNALRKMLLSSKNTFSDYLQLLRSVSRKPYDIHGDPLGELAWRGVAEKIADEEPFNLSITQSPSIEVVTELVRKIINQFKEPLNNHR